MSLVFPPSLIFFICEMGIGHLLHWGPYENGKGSNRYPFVLGGEQGVWLTWKLGDGLNNLFRSLPCLGIYNYRET